MKYLTVFKLFESYPPSQFEIQAEMKFKNLEPDLQDILVDASELKVKYDISKHISERSFDVSININRIKTKEQKKEVGEVVARINDYLNQSGMEFSSARIGQIIETIRDLGFGLPEPSRHAKREIWHVYDINEVIDLEKMAGEIDLNLHWFCDNEREWKE